MSAFEIFSDSSCDLPKEIVKQYNLHIMQLQVIIDDSSPVPNDQIEFKEFYEKLRKGANAKTSAVSPADFEAGMRTALSEGKDVLFIGFSSGLSATYANGMIAVNELREEFPDRKILDVDSLAACGGEGLLLFYACKLREAGNNIETVKEKVESIKNRLHHQFTVDDLFFLKRGGRINTATAIAGSVLQIKPVLDVNIKGKLETVGKTRGRKASLKELFNKLKANQSLEEFPYVFINHGDCIEDLEFLEGLIKEEYKDVTIITDYVGPVIGAHSGPGTVAMFYVGTNLKGE